MALLYTNNKHTDEDIRQIKQFTVTSEKNNME